VGLITLFGGRGIAGPGPPPPPPPSTVYTYTNLVPSYDIDNVFNRWTGTRDGGATQTWEDLDSQTSYGLRGKQITSLVASDNEVMNQLQWKTGQFSQPLNRVESITIMPLTDLTNRGQIDAGLGREVSDRITIVETRPGFAAAKTADYVIQHLTGSITAGPATSMELTFGLWPASTQAAWIAGDPNLSLAGVSTRPGY
jgi:hypothetical protein